METELSSEIREKFILHWNYRGFTELPSELQLGNNVKEIYLKENRIHCLPEWIASLESLTNLYLQGNNLKSLPQEIENLRLLEVLDISNNNIFYLPRTICNMKNLIQLIACNNRLMTLPEDLSGLVNLQVLRVNNNLLTTLPSSIQKLSKLSCISVSENKLLYLPNIKFPCQIDVSNNLFLNYLMYDHLGQDIKTTGCDRDSLKEYVGYTTIETYNGTRLVIPKGISFLCHSSCPLSSPSLLFELSLRILSQNSKASHYCVPEEINDYLVRGPASYCLNKQCMTPIFRSAVAKLGLRGNHGLTLELYCNSICCKIASLPPPDVVVSWCNVPFLFCQRCPYCSVSFLN